MKFLAVIGMVGVMTSVKCDAEANADPAILNSFLPSYSHLSQDESGRFVYVVNSVHGGNDGAEGDMGEADRTVQLPPYNFYPGYYPGACAYGACRNIPPQFHNGFNSPWSYSLPWGAYPGMNVLHYTNNQHHCTVLCHCQDTHHQQDHSEDILYQDIIQDLDTIHSYSLNHNLNSNQSR